MLYSHSKKKFLFLAFFICIIVSAAGQSMSKQDARQLIEKTLTCLKNSDTVSFLKLWHIDNAPWPYHKSPFNSKDLTEHFTELRKFLDTALAQNLKAEDIEIEKQDKGDKKNYWASYKIRAWFHYDKSYRKGIGFNVDRINNDWFYRFEPDYSTQTINQGSKH